MKRFLISMIAICFAVGCATTHSSLTKRQIERKLDTIIIPEMEFRQASSACTWVWFINESIRLDKTGKGIQIIMMNHDASQLRLITFSARDITLREALNIYCELGGLTWAVEDSVIKLRPIKGTVQPTPSN